MASDTATLDLDRVQAERRRLEGERDGAPPRIELGPDDRVPEGTGPVDVDPATRAHRIVQEVLAASAAPADQPEIEIPVTTDSTAAARARRIVEEVLAAAAEAPAAAPAHRDVPEPVENDEPTGATDATADHAPRTDEVRADLVLLGLPQPVVLVPGPVYEPRPAAYSPRPADDLPALVDDALEAMVDDAAPRSIREAIQGAAETSSMPGLRWVVAGSVWAIAFALVVPLAVRGIVSSVDLTVDLWGDQPATAEATASDATTAAP